MHLMFDTCQYSGMSAAGRSTSKITSAGLAKITCSEIKCAGLARAMCSEINNAGLATHVSGQPRAVNYARLP